MKPKGLLLCSQETTLDSMRSQTKSV